VFAPAAPVTRMRCSLACFGMRPEKPSDRARPRNRVLQGNADLPRWKPSGKAGGMPTGARVPLQSGSRARRCAWRPHVRNSSSAMRCSQRCTNRSDHERAVFFRPMRTRSPVSFRPSSGAVHFTEGGAFGKAKPAGRRCSTIVDRHALRLGDGIGRALSPKCSRALPPISSRRKGAFRGFLRPSSLRRPSRRRAGAGRCLARVGGDR